MLRFQQRAAVAFTCLGAVAVILLIISPPSLAAASAG